MLICRDNFHLDIFRVTSNPWLFMMRAATYIITQIRMFLRARERVVNIYAWTIGEIWTCPKQVETDGNPIHS